MRNARWFPAYVSLRLHGFDHAVARALAENGYGVCGWPS